MLEKAGTETLKKACPLTGSQPFNLSTPTFSARNPTVFPGESNLQARSCQPEIPAGEQAGRL